MRSDCVQRSPLPSLVRYDSDLYSILHPYLAVDQFVLSPLVEFTVVTLRD